MPNMIEIEVRFLLELKTGIIDAITADDGLDTSDGSYLIKRINVLLGLEECDHSRLPNNQWTNWDMGEKETILQERIEPTDLDSKNTELASYSFCSGCIYLNIKSGSWICLADRCIRPDSTKNNDEWVIYPHETIPFSIKKSMIKG